MCVSLTKNAHHSIMKASLEDTWMNKKMKKDVKLSPSAIIAVGFLLLILTATLLLMLPISAQNRQSTPLLTSLFTATSAVCVTGQALVDTGTHWSLFGQVVLIVAIQIGGLGVMTLMALVSMALGKRSVCANGRCFRRVSRRFRLAASFGWCALRCGERRWSRAAARCC